ncbi:MAG TPA: hypothetical protein VHN59_06625 [Chitinophagaceae bacterium]|nr:hypothetical protein [Chitinophagaceae bacterium]
MLRWFLTGMFVVVTGAAAFAQKGKLPPFRMVQENGVVFKAEQLPVGKPILLVYFSPDCDHCAVLAKQLLKKENPFKKASIAMITFLPLDKVAQFNRKYATSTFKNVFVGTEGGSFFLRKYFGIMEMPFVALYDKDGNLLQKYEKDIPFDSLSAKLNKL